MGVCMYCMGMGIGIVVLYIYILYIYYCIIQSVFFQVLCMLYCIALYCIALYCILYVCNVCVDANYAYKLVVLVMRMCRQRATYASSSSQPRW